MSQNKSGNNDIEQFMRLLASHQGQIYSYVLSLVGNYSDADDVCQETFSKMWELFDEFQLGSDFLRWSYAIARYRVLDYRKKVKRDKRISFNEEFFERVSEIAPTQLSKTNEYLEKLNNCIDHLEDRDAGLIKMRYRGAMQVKEIAGRINKTVRNIYFSLARIQRLLLECMNN